MRFARVRSLRRVRIGSPMRIRCRWRALCGRGLTARTRRESRNEGCMLMSKCLEQLARKYYGTKFVKIVSTDCIAKYPDSLLPTLIVYRNGKPEKNINGMGSFGGKRISPESECEASAIDRRHARPHGCYDRPKSASPDVILCPCVRAFCFAGVAYELNKLGAVCSLGGEDEEASQVEVIKSAVDRLILERELEDMREEADLDN